MRTRRRRRRRRRRRLRHWGRRACGKIQEKVDQILIFPCSFVPRLYQIKILAASYHSSIEMIIAHRNTCFLFAWFFRTSLLINFFAFIFFFFFVSDVLREKPMLLLSCLHHFQTHFEKLRWPRARGNKGNHSSTCSAATAAAAPWVPSAVVVAAAAAAAAPSTLTTRTPSKTCVGREGGV